MITKYEASATFIEGQSNGTFVSFYGDDEKGRLLRINISIEKLILLVKAYEACQSTGHAAWHVEMDKAVPCDFCKTCRDSVENERELNIEVGKALQEGWFWCTRCEKAYPKSEFAYYHFTGNYCKKCEAENPEAARRARNETYE